MQRVVVIGGGISGLAAAWDLTGGAPGTNADTPRVIVLESTDRLGGPLHSVTFGDQVIDVGPDGFLGRRPEALDLCREVGLSDSLVPIAGRGASVWARGRLRPLPDGLALGIPTRFWPAARSGILGTKGSLALARDVLLPKPDVRGPIHDRAVGPLVTRKLGHRVVDRLVDPLIGGIHAGSVDDMSTAATYPPLLAAAQRRGSLMRALRAETPAPDPDAPPLFWALRGGMSQLVDTLRAALQGRGVDIRTDTTAEGLDRRSDGWTIATGSEQIDADAVILAVPAPVASALLRRHDDEASGLLAAVDYASVALATFRVPLTAVPDPLYGTGFLVPRHSTRPGTKEGWIVTAGTFLSQKWDHLQQEGELLLRASLGRYGDRRAEDWDDAAVIERVWDELVQLMGLDGAPGASVVTRWPAAFPQYRVHHLLRTSGIESGVARLGGVAVAGATYRGVGIPACIASGRAAALAIQ
jgi:protoporphyrinogen/coproporphyrinogen III oxidase